MLSFEDFHNKILYIGIELKNVQITERFSTTKYFSSI